MGTRDPLEDHHPAPAILRMLGWGPEGPGALCGGSDSRKLDGRSDPEPGITV